MRRVQPYELWIGNTGDLADMRGTIDAGVRAVVDLALNERPPQLPRELVYCRFPLVDGAGNDLWTLVTAIEMVANLIKLKVPVLVCCSAGLSRSPAIVAAALSRVEQRRPEDCLKSVSKIASHDVAPRVSGNRLSRFCRFALFVSTGPTETKSATVIEQEYAFLITAGPTREYLDNVRFLSNASSGKMGYALVEAAIAFGHQVVLVSGPVKLAPPAGCEFHPVETTGQMYDACLQLFPRCDGVIGAAAVCDYRPLERLPGKLTKTGRSIVMQFVENPDILAELGRRKEQRWVVGFALESQDPRENALRKLQAKSCDAIVLNHPRAIGAESNRVELIDKSGQTVAAWEAGKSEIARLLVAWIDANLSLRHNPD